MNTALTVALNRRNVLQCRAAAGALLLDALAYGEEGEGVSGRKVIARQQRLDLRLPSLRSAPAYAGIINASRRCPSRPKLVPGV